MAMRTIRRIAKVDRLIALLVRDRDRFNRRARELHALAERLAKEPGSASLSRSARAAVAAAWRQSGKWCMASPELVSAVRDIDDADVADEYRGMWAALEAMWDGIAILESALIEYERRCAQQHGA